MIQLMFKKMEERILVIIEGNKVLFGNTAFGAYLAPIESLQLSYEGVILEHPDLKENLLWREEAIKRFKEKLNTFKNDEERVDYIIEDLRKHGFEPWLKQRQGFRPEVIR